MEEYQPSPEVENILNRAMAHIKSVEYDVSGRWLFYRLLQEGIFSAKSDVKKLEGYTSKARKRFWNGWNPKTLTDETRKIIWKGVFNLAVENWIEDLECELDKFQNQDYIILICYEAKAMTGQFEYYTNHLPLIAFGGDASIHYKKRIAEAIEWVDNRYNKNKNKNRKPIKILYFGDCDAKGRQIYQSAFKDIYEWCSVPFDLIYCGLTQEQAKDYNLPSNPEKPNQYQWEALTDEQAKELITNAVNLYQDSKKIEAVEKTQEKILKQAKEVLLNVKWSKKK